MTSDEYSKNLITYFDNSHSQTTVTIADLQNVLLALNQETLSNKQTTVNYPCFRFGDYVAAFWIDDNDEHEWYLANFVETCSTDTDILSYLKRLVRARKVRFGHIQKCLRFLKLTPFSLLVAASKYHTFVLPESSAV